MSSVLPAEFFNLKSQCVRGFTLNSNRKSVTIHCHRDKRLKPKDQNGNRPTTVNLRLKKLVQDLPLLSLQTFVEIEFLQVVTQDGRRQMESLPFVDVRARYTNRFCRLVSALCRHMSINAVAKHFGLRWGTVKDMDKQYLESTLPGLDPTQLTNLKHIGVDEVARAKGHNYMTVVYNMETGGLIYVAEGRTSDVFSSFLEQLPESTKQGIEAVVMDMGPAYQKAVRESLPNADIVFDRFHVMKNYGKVIDNQRREEFRKAEKESKEMIKGSRYLLLKNEDKLTDIQKKN